MNYAVDFETTTDENDCRVWAWSLATIEENPRSETGNTIKGFMQRIFQLSPSTFFFHNLKWDGEFVISWLLTNHYRWVESEPSVNEFTTLISDKRIFYAIEIVTKNKQGKIIHTKIQDSMKLIPLSIEKIASKFGLEESKLKIDYEAFREYGHKLTPQEDEYVRTDSIIAAKALTVFFSQGLTRMTVGSNAMESYRKLVGKQFEQWFPVPDYDADIRPSYKGGWCYCNPTYQGLTIGKGRVYDDNSLYPSRMYYELMPYGNPIRYQGEYKLDNEYPLYIQYLRCKIRIKEGYLPTIQLTKTLSFQSTKYVDEIKELTTLCLSNVDLDLMFDHYDILEYEPLYGYKFKGKHDMFKAYIEYWMNVKIEAEMRGDKAMREVAKFYLNNLYGKFSASPKGASLMPVLDDKGIVKYKPLPVEDRKIVYLPVGIYTTAYGRNLTIRSAQKNYERFVYSDTDSIHLVGMDEIQGVEVHKTKLGAWKNEANFVKARYLRPKTYMETLDNGSINIKACGIPDKIKQNLTYDNFYIGYETDQKLRRKVVKGGVILQKSKYKIREN